MKKKRMQRWIAMLLAATMLSSAMESTGLAQTLENENNVEAAQEQNAENPKEFQRPENVKTWGDVEKYLCQLLGWLSEDGANLKLEDNDDRYRAILIDKGALEAEDFQKDAKKKITEEEWKVLLAKIFPARVETNADAESVRITDESENLLVTADDSELTGITAGGIASVNNEKLELFESKVKSLSVYGTKELKLSATEAERLWLHADKGENISLQTDFETKIPEVIVTGEGSVTIEGSGAFGVVRVMENVQKLTVRATCSIINETDKVVSLEEAEGQREELQPNEQKELILSGYVITFVADGQTLESKTAKPGEVIEFPDSLPEKRNQIFTSWYKDAEFTESVSQFEVAEGQTTYYARYISKEDAVTVQFDVQEGKELEPVTLAKGESLLTRPVEEIYTNREGYIFGGWCVDEECTESFAYSEPVEEDMTLYAFFISEEAQTEEKSGDSAELKDFEWNGKIALKVNEGMTLADVQNKVKIKAGSGENDPEITVSEEKGNYFISGCNYEKDGEKGFEPGSTFSLILEDGVHFADYAEEVTTLAVSVFKEQVETVVFAEDMDYVLWDDVISYTPAKEASEENLEEDAEKLLETEVVKEKQNVEEEKNKNDDDNAENNEEKDTQEIKNDSEADEKESEEQEDTGDENTETEWETPAYIPGEIEIKGEADYKEGDLVAFYDGEIGQDEKTMDSYTEGSFDGYVLYAKVEGTEKTDDGTKIKFVYASAEEYLADFDVHMTQDADLEQELTEEDLTVLSSRLSSQVEKNDELKAQMLVAVMSSKETQKVLDEKYGEGAYSLAQMSARLKLNKPSVSLSVSGSTVTAQITVSASATITNNGKAVLTVNPKLSFTQSLEVKMNVNGGKFWIDMSVSFLSTTKIALTISATSGGSVSVLENAKKTLEELVKPEGIEGKYEEYDKSVKDLMETMNSIVSTSLAYNDLFDVVLLNLKYSFYGIITIGVEVHFVGQIGVLATFGIEIVAKSGERIGFNYKFLKFKGSSYTEKLDNSVTSNIYLIGKVGVRVGVRLVLSITVCGIVKTSISGSLYLYAELTGVYFFTANLVSGANTGLGALYFEVGIDVVVTLSLQVRLIFKTIRKNWTVYTGRWPLWSTSVSSKMSYVNEDEMEKQWESATKNADHKIAFGFETIPMKTWDLMGGGCTESALLSGKINGSSAKAKLTIENLKVNGANVPAGDPKAKLFTVGNSSKGQNTLAVYMDETVAAEQMCEEAELDVVFTYENNSTTALVKKQVKRFHLKKKCSLATTTHHVKVKLYDWCARNWDLAPASWDGAEVYTASFSNSHMLGGGYASTATGNLNLGEALSAAQAAYPELAAYNLSWAEPTRDGSQAVMQYSVPRYSDFCFMTPETGVVRYDVRAKTDSYEVTYYLYVRKFEGYEDTVRYHVRMDGASAGNNYEFSTRFSENGDVQKFTKQADGIYLLEAQRKQFDTTEQPLLMAVNGREAAATGFVISGQEMSKDVYFDISLGNIPLGIQLGDGVDGYEYADPSVLTEEGIKAGTVVELNVSLKEGYGGLEVLSDNKNVVFTVKDNVVSFVMPAEALSITLQAYRLHSITYLYNYKGYGTYKKVYFAENQKTEKEKSPEIEGMTFRGWYASPEYSGEQYQFGDKLQTDITLYADWTCDVTVHFAPAKGTASYWKGTEENGQEEFIFENDRKTYYKFTYSTLRPGEDLLNIQVPEYEGYQFMGWYTDSDFSGTPVDLETAKATAGLHLYANWAKMVSVIFDRNDGSEQSEYEEINGFVGYPLTLIPEDPSRKYYSFTGWYKNAAATVAFDCKNEKITGKTRLYAGWKADTYAIKYNLNGGVNAEKNLTQYTTEMTFALDEPTREGYTFEGWTGTDLTSVTKQVTVSTGNGGDRSYTAVWSPISYSITYNRTFGTAEDNPTSYTIESEDIVLERPSRVKYEFKGWTGEKLTEPTLDVCIPKGSTGDRIYTAVWETSDPILNILQQVEWLITGHPYEGNLVTFLSESDFMKDEIDYETLEKKLTETVNSYLLDLIKNDEKIGAYSDQIRIRISLDKEFTDLYSDSKNQHYTFSISAAYIDDNGVQTPAEPEAFDYSATLKKMVPRVTWPTASKLSYGQQVFQSEFSDDGAALYVYGMYEIPVWGYFNWKNEDAGEVPYGRNNGTEASSYRVDFVPARDDCFASAEGSIDVVTQIGVTVSGNADSRDYIPGKTDTTGSAVLVYVDQDGNPTEDRCEAEGLLTGGVWNFANDRAEKRKEVIFSGYALDSDRNVTDTYGENAYVLLENKTEKCYADINPVQQDNAKLKISVPSTKDASYDYGTVIGDMGLVNGKVQYQVNETDAIDVEGKWSWKTDEMEKVPDAGTGSYTAVFVPDDKYEGGYETITVQVPVTVNKVQVEVPLLDDRTYDGNTAAAEISGTARYRVKKNDKVKNAGTYTVELELTDLTNYVWKESTSDKVKIQGAVAMISYQILPASIIVNVEKATVENILYGQKLTQNAADKTETVNGVENILTEVTAKGRVNGYSVAYAESSGAPAGSGNWSWVTSQGTDGKEQLTVMSAGGETTVAQPLAAGTYQVKARFTPADGNLNTYDTYLPVTINKSVPYVGYTLESDSFYLPEGDTFQLKYLNIGKKDNTVHNRYTGETITGTWEWDDEELEGEKNRREFGVTYKLNDKNNYVEPGTTCHVALRPYIKIMLELTADDRLMLNDNDVGNKDKYGFIPGKSRILTARLDQSDPKIKEATFVTDCWQYATDQSGAVKPESMLKVAAAYGSYYKTYKEPSIPDLAYLLGYPTDINISVEPLQWIPGWKTVITMSFTKPVYGDPNVTLEVVNAGGTADQSAAQPQKAVKADKNEQKKQGEDTSTANIVQTPETITPTPDSAAPEEPTPTPEPSAPEEPAPEPEPTVPEKPSEPESPPPAPEQPEANAEQTEETAEQRAEENQTVQESSGT